MLSLPDEARTNTVNLFTWFPAGALRVNIGFLTDPLSVTWIMLVTGVGSLIHLYAIGYMHGDPRFSRFFAYLNLFAASMLILVLGSSFLVTFLGWEGVGLCSYLLISHWFERNRAAVAGQEGVRRQPGRRLRVHARDVLHHRQHRQPRLRRDEPAGREHPAHDRDRDRAAAVRRLHRQERADPVARLAPRRDGGPDPGLGADPRGDDGDRRHLPAVPRASVLRGERRRDDGGRVDRRRARRCSRARSRSSNPTSNGCWRTRPSASSATCSSPAGSARTRPRSSWSSRTPATRARSSSVPVRSSTATTTTRTCEDRRAAQVHAVHRGRVHPRLARDQRHPTALRLLRQGRDHLGRVLHAGLRALDRRGRGRRDHRDLHDPRDAAHVLRQRAVPRRARRRTRSRPAPRPARTPTTRGPWRRRSTTAARARGQRDLARSRRPSTTASRPRRRS